MLNEPIYLKPIIAKLPRDVQSRWQRHVFRFMNDKKVPYPPFIEVARFIREVSREKIDTSLCLNPAEDNVNEQNKRTTLRQAYKTDLTRVHYSPNRKLSDQGSGALFIKGHIPSTIVLFSGQNQSRKGEVC